jgi:hypothetical protein
MLNIQANLHMPQLILWDYKINNLHMFQLILWDYKINN